jgi:hypothetical protein
MTDAYVGWKRGERRREEKRREVAVRSGSAPRWFVGLLFALISVQRAVLSTADRYYASTDQGSSRMHRIMFGILRQLEI